MDPKSPKPKKLSDKELKDKLGNFDFQAFDRMMEGLIGISKGKPPKVEKNERSGRYRD